MKKFLFIFWILSVAIVGRAQEVIEMEHTGSGSYYIWCSVNGAKLRMVFDTGASGVSLSSKYAEYLLQNGFLQKSDLLKPSTSTIADGSSVPIITAILRDVAIGSVHIRNIQASIDMNQEAPMLLGMSAIQSLGTVTIDGNRLIIHKTTYTKDDVAKLEREVDDYISNGNYSAAFNNLLKINQVCGLTADNAFKHALCCYQMELYADCIGSCLQWFKYFDGKDNDRQWAVYEMMAESCLFEGYYADAIPYYQKLLSKGGGDSDDVTAWQFGIATCYFNIDDIQHALPYIRSAASMRRKSMGVTINDIQYGRVHDETLGLMFQVYASCFLKADRQRDGIRLLVIAARCGDETSRQVCKENHIRF